MSRPSSKRIQLGEILLRNNLVTAAQLRTAEELQARAGRPLDEAVVELGYTTDNAIAVALSKQFGIPYASRQNRLLKTPLGMPLAPKLEPRFLLERVVFPLFLNGRRLALAMADPTDAETVKEVAAVTGLEVKVFVAPRREVLAAIDQLAGRPAPGAGTIALAERLRLVGGAPSTERLDLEKAAAGQADSGVVRFVNAVLRQAAEERASDIHLGAYRDRISLRFRIDGVLYDRTPPTPALYSAVVGRIKILANLDIAEKRLPQDGALAVRLEGREIDARISTCPTIYGEGVVLRVLVQKSAKLDLDLLGLEGRQKGDLLEALERPHGLIFLSGPTSSGKTSSLYTLIDKIKSPEIKIVTVDDPVEHQIDGVDQVQVRPQIGLTYAAVLRSLLRQDPDVILVGEVRDPETAQICLQASLTGHLVLSTLHSNAAVESVSRLVNLGLDPFILSSSLCLVGAQRLVRVLCPACKQPYKPEGRVLEAVLRESRDFQTAAPDLVRFYRNAGCSRCAKTGFVGRVGVFEIIPVSGEIKRLINANASDLRALQGEVDRQGILSLRASGWRKVLAGVTTVEEVLSTTIGV